MRKPQQEDSEAILEELEYKPVNWKKIFLSWKYLPIHILAIAAGIASILLVVYHDQIVTALRPISEKIRELPAGWLIPIVILFIISFPPLFGHEIIALLCGVVYDFGIGFAIVAAGTFLGELGTWFAFKSLLRNKAIKLERTNLNYGALARLTRDKGFWMVLVIRVSVVPSHFSTAVFSTCDVKFWHFAVATFLSLPKQAVLVYLGVLLAQNNDTSNTDRTSNIVKDVIFAITGVITVALGYVIWRYLVMYKKILLDEQAERKRNLQMQNLPRSNEYALDEEEPATMSVQPQKMQEWI